MLFGDSNVWKGMHGLEGTHCIPFDEVRIDEKLHFIEEPIEIVDKEEKQLKQSRIPIVKVRWNSSRGPEYTWEQEDQMLVPSCFFEHEHVVMNPTSAGMRHHHLHLYVDSKNLLDRFAMLASSHYRNVSKQTTIFLIISSIHLMYLYRYPVDTSLIHIEFRKSPIAVLFDDDTGRISIRHCTGYVKKDKTKEKQAKRARDGKE
ncbi:hypothetical protein Tco_1001532 [Tanacetum coccineum]